uniref:Non-capsid protein NS-1 n=1 Tax=Cacopsylla melanoneura TaxID=428564 RepID=A0A8D9B8A1_9HEMI
MGRRRDSGSPFEVHSGSVEGNPSPGRRGHEEEMFGVENRNRNSSTRNGLRECIVAGLQERATRNRILHDIYQRQSESGMDQKLHEIIQSGEFRGAVFIEASHGDHYHVVHDCTWTSSQCRCGIIQRIENVCGRRRKRSTIRGVELSVDHIYNLLVYLQSGGRTIHHVQVGCASSRGRISREVRDLRDRRNQETRKTTMVESSEIEDLVREFVVCQGNESGRPTQRGHRRTNGRGNATDPQGAKGDAFLAFVRNHPCSPMLNIFHTRHWTTGPFKYQHKGDPLLKTIMHNRAIELMDMSMKDLYEFYCNLEPTKLIFNAPLGNIGDYYYSVDESIMHMEALLLFQFNNNEDLIRIFLEDLYNIIDKRLPKRNSMFILSRPNAGKNWFFDCFLHFFLNFGQIGNFNKHQSFPLQEAVNKRILLWNEPNAEPGAMDTLKMLLGGDTFNAKIKYEHDAVVVRTPVIILSNNDIFPKDAAFNSRLIRSTWRSAPLLKHVKKKPHPIAAYQLLERWNIFDSIETDTENNTDTDTD